MKVYFFVLGKGNSTTSFSNLMFANALIKKGYDVDIIENLNEKYALLKDCKADIIFFQKTIQCPAHTTKYISHLKGKVFLCHIDDDFQDMKNEEHIKTLKLTDLVLVGTEAHKRALKDYTDRPVETINCLLDSYNYPYTPAESKNNDSLVIGWQQSCADAYVKDLLSISQPLIDLHNKYDFILNLYGWHMGIDYRDLSAPAREAFPFANFIAFKPMDLYIKETIPLISHSDIFLAPYIDIPDRIGKSGFSLKRMMHLGLPVVASGTEHHKYIIDDGINGFVANSDAEWYDKLEKLLLDSKLRSNFSYNAYKKMEEFYNEDAVINHFINKVQKNFNKFIP